MTGARILVLTLAWVTLSAWTVSAQNLSAYRNFRLGASLAAIAAQAGISPEPRDVHRRPALLQELMWQPARATNASQPTDSVRKVVFSFYNDELFRIVVDYDPRRTEGLTPADMMEALSMTYGLATLPATGFLPSARTPSQSGERLVVSWEDTNHAVSLITPDASRFALVIVSKPIDALAKVAAADALWMDRLEAPQREVERRQQQTEADRAKEETARRTNKAAFRP
jgi:hypothetical protein